MPNNYDSMLGYLIQKWNYSDKFKSLSEWLCITDKEYIEYKEGKVTSEFIVKKFLDGGK